jgi:hypothetical protein
MPRRLIRLTALLTAGAVFSAGVLAWYQPPPPESPPDQAAAPAEPATLQPGVVNCGNLIYGNNKTSKCFSPEFLTQIGRETHITANPGLVPVHLESSELFNFPFAVMTGEGAWTLTPPQRENMRNYLQAGGFIIASAGCSSEPWQQSFRREIAQVFPELKLANLDMSHPVFHTVYEIRALQCKHSSSAHLEGLEIDGKFVLIFSPDGLNDTGKAGGNCCCCGGDEIRNARQVNVNLLAYTLTH